MNAHPFDSLELLRSLVLSVVLALILIVPASADISGGICPINQFSVGATSGWISGMTRGLDGDIWFIKPVTSTGYYIVKMTPNGTLTEFSVDGTPFRLAYGSDQNVWYTRSDSGVVSRLTLSGTIAAFPLPGNRSDGITVGADANLWLTDSSGNQIERVNLEGSVTGQFAIPTANSSPSDIVLGADDNLWFIESATNKIGRISTSGIIAEFLTVTPSAYLTNISPGPDGNIWFAETVGCVPYCSYSYYNRITPDGTITRFGSTYPISGITAGSDGNLWAILLLRYNFLLGRIAMDGSLTTYGFPSTYPLLFRYGRDIVSGGDGKIWVGTGETGSYNGQSIEAFDPHKPGCYSYLPWVVR